MSWRPKTIIRNKNTGKPLLVLHSYKGATVVVDLEDKSNPTPTQVLLERDYTNWIDEKRLEVREKKESWSDDPEITFSLAAVI